MFYFLKDYMQFGVCHLHYVSCLPSNYFSVNLPRVSPSLELAGHVHSGVMSAPLSGAIIGGVSVRGTDSEFVLPSFAMGKFHFSSLTSNILD